MSFSKSPPTIQDFLDAYRAGIVGRKDNRADLSEGSKLEQIGGTAAIAWSRLALRNVNLFDDSQTSSATGDALTKRVSKIYGIDRILDTMGAGTANISRPDTSLGGDTIWQGTRIELVSHSGIVSPSEYEVTEDTPVSATATNVQLPIRAMTLGNAIDVRPGDDIYARIADGIWDTSWTVNAMTCSEGSAFESAGAYRARAKQARLDQRFGQYQSLFRACASVGAKHVVLFPSNYGGDDQDHGLNRLYVGDDTYNASTTLLRNCIIALEKARCLGDQLQIGPMVPTPLTVNAVVFLSVSPAKVDTTALIRRLRAYTVAALRQDYTYSLDAFRGAMYEASSLVQDVTFNNPPVDGPVLTLVNGVLNFPDSLPRYTMITDNVSFSLRGPNG